MKAVYEATIKVRIEEEIKNDEIEPKEYMDNCFKRLIGDNLSNKTTNSVEIESTLEILK